MSNKSPLVGMFFHSWNFFEGERKLGWQGVIEQEIGSGFYLCQLFEWICGTASNHVVVHLKDMDTWYLYRDEESWQKAARAI